MTDKGKQFMDMFREKLGMNHEVLPIINKMIVMLEPMGEFDEMMEIYSGMESYGEFLTEKEAKSIADHMINFDKTRGPKWKPDILFDAVRTLGGTVDKPGSYNKWALYVLMNKQHSDYGESLQKLVQGSDYAKLCYELALDDIYDPDKKVGIRHKYGLHQ